MDKSEINLKFDSIEHLINIFGNFDENVKLIERAFGIKIISRDDEIKIVGETGSIKKASDVIKKMYDISVVGDVITKQNVIYFIEMAKDDLLHKVDYYNDYVCLTDKGKKIKAKTEGQKLYIDAIKNNIITFGIGPAGTGKTFLAVALAVDSFRNKEVSRIILTRPAVEAGEKLGFLPGDLQNKVDPYLRPLYDSLFEIMGAEAYYRYCEKNMIEVAPLAYMRGRTLDNSFIILDEAQNTTPEQMKMFLTRIGFGSKMVVTGDVTQIDLPRDKKSGLREAKKILNKVREIEFVTLTDKDVVRHELVQRIIKAYDRYEGR